VSLLDRSTETGWIVTYADIINSGGAGCRHYRRGQALFDGVPTIIWNLPLVLISSVPSKIHTVVPYTHA